MGLFLTQYQNNSRIVSGTPVIYDNDSILLCDTSTDVVIINLLEIPPNYWNTTWKLYIVDNSNNAATNNITINAPSGFTINDSASTIINTNGGTCVIRIAANTKYLGNLSSFVGSSTTPLAIYENGTLKTASASALDFVDWFALTTIGTDVSISIYDTDWVDLEGFSHMPVGYRPQFRIIGKQVYFKGVAVIPLSNDGGATVIPMTATGTGGYYVNAAFADTYTGSGGCTITSDYEIYFNNGNVILPAPYDVLSFDSNMSFGMVLSYRSVNNSAGDTGVVLTTITETILTTDLKLGVRSYQYFEVNQYVPDTTDAGKGLGTARPIIGNVISGQIVPDYTSTGGGSTTSSAAAVPFTRSYAAATGSPSFVFNVDSGNPNEMGGFQINLSPIKTFLT
jgi:hypothetical protein